MKLIGEIFRILNERHIEPAQVSDTGKTLQVKWLILIAVHQRAKDLVGYFDHTLRSSAEKSVQMNVLDNL
jgi:hypothetical protein